jgi:hypothetical protein
MKSCVLFLLFCLTLVSPAFAEPLVITGPFGVPLKIQDEAGNWSIPIRVYSDPDVDMFVSDITSVGWKSWHAAKFRQDGTYIVQILLFHKNKKYCLSTLSTAQRSNPDYQEACSELKYTSELLVVDTRKMTVETVMKITMGEDAGFHPEYQRYPRATYSFFQMDKVHQNGIDKVSSIVRDEIVKFTGRTSP